MDDKNIKTNNAILALLLEQQEIEQVKKEVGLVPNGDEYETHAGKFFTSANLITLRDKVDFGLGSTNFAGLVAKNYDGANEGQLVFGADGYARVGDKGNLQMIATREDTPLSNGIAFYDNATKKFNTKAESTLSVAQAANANKLGTYAASQYLRNDIDNPKLSVSGGLTFTLEADSDNSNESDNVTLILSQDGGGNTASLGLNSSNDLYLNHGSKQVFKYDEGEEDIIFDSTVHSSAKFNKTVLYSPTSSNDIMSIRRYGSDHTVLNVWSPPQTSWGGAKESTLSLVRGDGNEYFMDFYNMDYGSSDQGNNLDYGEPEMGIRLQKRGSGAYTPFYIEYGNGSEEFKALEIRPNGTDTSNQSSVTLNRLIANYDGDRKFETTTSGTKTIGNSIATADFISGDPSQTTFFNSVLSTNALTFYPNGSNTSYIDVRRDNSSAHDGSLSLRSSFEGTNHTDMAIFKYENVLLYQGGNLKFQTTSSGTKTTGDHLTTGKTFITNTNSYLRTTGVYLGLVSGGNEIQITGNSDNLHVNYRKQDGRTAPATWYWKAGSSGSNASDYASFYLNNLYSHGTVGSNSYSSGFSGSGWRVDNAGNGTLDSLTVRKTFSVYELLIQKIRSVNGSIVVSPANGKIKSISFQHSGATLEVVLEEAGGFKVGDRYRCQTFTGRNVRYYVSGNIGWISSDKKKLHIYNYTNSHTGDIPQAGDEIVQWGSTDATRQGMLYMTSSDNDAPYLDVLDGVNGADMTDKTKVRLGKLDGITDSELGNLTGYGLYSQNVFLKGKIVANSGKIGGW
ncbi:MAG: hypothetical protein N4A59_14865, partial [Marinifilum sp.]|nr:hypothetical protein [Marinifilum sp.]